MTVVTHFWNELRKLLRLLRETSKQPGPNRCRSVPGGSFSPQPLCMLFRQSSVYTSAANDQCDVRTVNSWYSVLILVFITGSSPAQHKCTDPLFYPFFSYLSRSVSLSIIWNNANRHTSCTDIIYAYNDSKTQMRQTTRPVFRVQTKFWEM